MSNPKEGSRDVQEGIIVSIIPDICLTPSGGGMVPVPYTIWCRQADAANLANSVRQIDDRSHVIASLVLQCFGDEPGTGGGIFSGTTGAECTPKTWSRTVRAEDRNMARHTDEWWMNHRNTYGSLNYTKDTALYETPEADRIRPKIRAPSPTVQSGAPLTAQPSQPLQAGATAVGGGFGGGIEIPSPWDAVKGAGRAIGVGGAATLGLATAFLLASTTSTAEDDIRVTGDCKLVPWKNNTCPPGSQRHHVVAGRSLSPSQLAYRDGLTLCLKGNAFPRTLLTGHAVAQAGYDLSAKAAAAKSPDGMLPLGQAENLGSIAAAAGAKADGRNCNPAAFKMQLGAYHGQHGLTPETRVKP